MVQFESPLELDLLYRLDIDPDVISYESQPVRIEYVDKGKARHYTPDFLIHRRSGSKHVRLLCEVKTLSDLDKDWRKYSPGLSAAGHYAERRGWTFEVYSEYEIRTDYLWNAKLLWEHCREPAVQRQQTKVLWAMNALKRCTLSEIAGDISALPDEESAARTRALWQLIAQRRIRTDLERRLHGESVLWI